MMLTYLYFYNIYIIWILLNHPKSPRINKTYHNYTIVPLKITTQNLYKDMLSNPILFISNHNTTQSLSKFKPSYIKYIHHHLPIIFLPLNSLSILKKIYPIFILNLIIKTFLKYIIPRFYISSQILYLF